MRKVLLTFLILAVVSPCLAKYSGGTGEPNNPYQIATAADLNDISNHSMEDFNKCFVMTNDIDMTGYNQFNCIPYFSGTFDGNHHVVHNLQWSKWTSYEFDWDIGMFKYLDSGGKIQNLGLQDANIDARPEAPYVGGLVGHIGQQGEVSRCYVTGKVYGGSDVGGLVGYSEYGGRIAESFSRAEVIASGGGAGGLVGSNGNGTIQNCYSVSRVLAEDGSAGGLVAWNDDAVINCFAAGQIEGLGDVGGLIGGGGVAANCYWDTSTSGLETSSGGKERTTEQMKMAGTFVGWNGCGEIIWTIDEGNDYPHLAWENANGYPIPQVPLSNLLEGTGTQESPYLIYDVNQLNLIGAYICDWDNHFKLMNDINLSGLPAGELNRIGMSYIWPFCGFFDGNGKTISNFVYRGDSLAKAGFFGGTGRGSIVQNLRLKDVDVNVYGYYAGALAAINRGTITNCVVTGSVVGWTYTGGLVGMNCGYIRNCGTQLNICSGFSYVGGIAGSNGGYTVGYGDSNGTVEGCYAAGSLSGEVQVGGIIGSNNGIWNVVNVSDSYADVNVTGNTQMAGGLLGECWSGNVRRCCSAGHVSGNYLVGGLIGSNRCTVTASFWDVNTSGQKTSAGGTGKTTVEMQTKSTFTNAGWDFVWETTNGTDDIWAICEGVSYPKLAWQFIAGDSDNDKNVDFTDFAPLANKWMQADSNLYCGGADLTGDGIVDMLDIAVFADDWLVGL